MTTVQRQIPLSILTQDGTRVVIDPLSEMILLGTTIDYVKEDYDKG